MDDIRKTFEIGTTACPLEGVGVVNQQELTQRIAADLEKFPLKTPANWPEFSITTLELAASATAIDPDLADLYAALEQATHAYDQIWVDIEVMPSRWPLLTRLKKNLHQLVVFYVNRLGERQIKFNDRILRTANLLAAAQMAKNEETAVLKQQITSLQQRLDAIEKQQP